MSKNENRGKSKVFELRKKLMKGEISELEAVELKALLEKMKEEATKPFEKRFLRITELVDFLFIFIIKC